MEALGIQEVGDSSIVEGKARQAIRKGWRGAFRGPHTEAPLIHGHNRVL